MKAGLMASGGSIHADATVTAVTNILLAIMGFCTGVLSARILGPHGRGELAAIQVTPSAIGTIAMIGMPEALVYFSAREPDRAGRLLVNAMVLALSAAAPLMVIGYLAMPMLLRAQGGRVIAYARGYLLIAALYATSGMLYHPLRGCGHFYAWNALRLLVPLAALCVLGAAYVTNRMTPEFVAFGNLASYALLFAPCAFVVAHRTRGPFALDKQNFMPMLRFGLPCVMTAVPQLLNLRLDQMLMGALLPAQDLGLYVVAVAWSSAVSPILSSIGTVMLPSVASTGELGCAAERMARGIRMTSALAAVVCVAVGIASPFLIPTVFGQGYRASLSSALILVPAAGVLGVNFSLQESLRGLGYPYTVLRAEFLGLITTAICLALLLRPAGIVGAAIASLLGYLTVSVILLESARRVAAIPVGRLIVPSKGELTSGLMRLMGAFKMSAPVP